MAAKIVFIDKNHAPGNELKQVTITFLLKITIFVVPLFYKLKVKKLIFSIFVVLWTINLVPVLELIKIENLLVHYIKHKSESDHFSLYQFLTMHYLNTPVQDDDYEEDMQLPFKSLISTFSFSTFHYPPVIYSFTSVLNTPSDEVTSFVSGFSIYKSEFIFNIWQPPRQS